MRIKRLLSAAAKLAVSAVLIGYLVHRAASNERFGELLAAQKNWPLLVGALPICLFAVTATILRWHLLLKALHLEFSVRDTLRAGYIGYLANLLPFGLVAGDSLKALLLMQHNPRRKTEAVASVLVDRVVGLYALLLLAAMASLLLPAEQLMRLSPVERPKIEWLCWTVQWTALASSLGLAVMLIPAVTQSRWWDLLEHAPFIGPVLHKLVGAMRAYRRRAELLLVGVAVSLVLHLGYASAIVVMTLGMGIPYQYRPQIGAIYIIVPPSMIAGALPIGVFELVLNVLFDAASPPGAPQDAGLLIALGYRLIQICIATIGVSYWLAGRRDVRGLVRQAEATPVVQLTGEEKAEA